jgi:hypothetical protein
MHVLQTLLWISSCSSPAIALVLRSDDKRHAIALEYVTKMRPQNALEYFERDPATSRKAVTVNLQLPVEVTIPGLASWLFVLADGC